MPKKLQKDVKSKTLRLRVTESFFNEMKKYSTDNNISFSKLTRDLINESLPIQARTT